MVAFLASVSLAAVPTVSWADHSWGNYHWERAVNRLDLELGGNLTNGWDPHLNVTSEDWSYSSVVDTTIVPGKVKNPKNCKATNGRVEVCSSNYGSNGWLGLAQIWVSGNHITKAIVKLNDTYFSYDFYNTIAWRNLVMCQEVGHTLGLAHRDEDFDNAPLGTCMDYSSDPEPNQHPDDHDYDQLATIYGHAHDDTSDDSGPPPGRGRGKNRVPPAMDQIELTGPPQWGQMIRRSNNGWTEVYRVDFGRGHKVFTFVIWAEGVEDED